MHGNILIVDDNPDNLKVLEAILIADGHEVRPAMCGETALKTVAVRLPELILLDAVMPGMDGFEVCRRLKADPATSGIPILFISALSEQEDKLKAFESGGVDYITKPFSGQEVLARVRTHLRLAAALKQLRETNQELSREVEARKSAEEELRLSEQKYMEMSITDSLTNLFNSRHFFRQLGYETERAKRNGTPLSLVLMDIDNFKSFNDTYGHPEGDSVLRVLSNVIMKNLRVSDTAYRYGGEEFTVLLPETEGKNAVVVADRLRKDFEEVTLSPGVESIVQMTVSVGVSRYIPDEQVSTFLKRVDGAMYKAKKAGKNRVIYG